MNRIFAVLSKQFRKMITVLYYSLRVPPFVCTSQSFIYTYPDIRHYITYKDERESLNKQPNNKMVIISVKHFHVNAWVTVVFPAGRH
jgi:hypothetical protein